MSRIRSNLSTTPAVRGGAQALPFADKTFDGTLAWGVMFHLPQAEQVRAIASVGRVLKPGGSFWFTAGDVDDDRGTHITTMNGVEFPNYSFSADGYWSVLRDHGLRLVDYHEDKVGNGYYLATRRY